MIIKNPTIEDLRRQVEEHAYCHVQYPPKRNEHLLDMYSMSVLVQLYDALKAPEAKKKLDAMVSTSFEELQKAINFGLRHIK